MARAAALSSLFRQLHNVESHRCLVCKKSQRLEEETKPQKKVYSESGLAVQHFLSIKHCPLVQRFRSPLYHHCEGSVV
jgi:hypothetical protein